MIIERLLTCLYARSLCTSIVSSQVSLASASSACLTLTAADTSTWRSSSTAYSRFTTRIRRQSWSSRSICKSLFLYLAISLSHIIIVNLPIRTNCRTICPMKIYKSTLILVPDTILEWPSISLHCMRTNPSCLFDLQVRHWPRWLRHPGRCASDIISRANWELSHWTCHQRGSVHTDRWWKVTNFTLQALRCCLRRLFISRYR